MSQFFDEWPYELQGGRAIPVAKFIRPADNCPYGVVDNRTHTVVMVCRVYDRNAGIACESAKFPVNFLANFLGLPSP